MPGPDLSGEVFDRRYRIVERLSEGAMGVVYRAVRTRLDRPVAIKVLHLALPANMRARERFEREAKLMARLDHPHCVSIIDYGIHDQNPYVVMELVRGQSLLDMLAEQGRFEISRAVDIMCQILSGLSHAHEQGIIHRDIKPANIMITPKAPLGLHVRILDFGLARMLDADTSLSDGVAVGTPSYMAPEQCRGEPPDAQTDVYACGVVLFEMLTGKKPLTSDDPLVTMRKQTDDMPPRLADVAPGDYGALEHIVARALRKAPADRFRSAAALSEALGEARRGRAAPESTLVLPRVEQQPPPAPTATSSTAPITEVMATKPRSPDRPIVRPPAPRSRARRRIVVLLLALAAAAAAFVLRDRLDERTVTRQPPAPPRWFEVPRPPTPATGPAVPEPSPATATAAPAGTEASPPPTPVTAVAAGPETSPPPTPVTAVAAGAETSPSPTPVTGVPAGAEASPPPTPVTAVAAGTEASPPPAIAAAPLAVDAGALDAGDVSAGADPVAGIVIAAKQLATTGKLARALDIVIAGRALYRDRAELPLLAGKLYFSKYWWTDGIASFREAVKLDPSLRGDPELIEAAVNGFMTTPDWDGRLAGFVLEIGPGALQTLEALAQSHRVPALRTRAAALAKRLQTTRR